MSGSGWLGTGAILAGLAVVAGAFGAHALADQVSAGKLEPRMLEVFETAARYQMYHAIALLVVGMLVSKASMPGLNVAGWAFLTGIIVFSGSLYALVFTGIKVLGAITPIGGVLMILGWLAMAVACFRMRGTG